MKKRILLMLPMCMLTIFAVCQSRKNFPDYTVVTQQMLTDGKINPIGTYPITNQSIIVTGIVTDDHGLPLSDVSVRIASTNASTGTDSLGQYRIYAASDTCTLIFETFGAWPMKENIKGRSIINISVQYPDTSYGAFLQLFKQDEAVAYKP